MTKNITKNYGITSYIIPDRLMLNTQCNELRNWLLNEQTIIEIDSFDESVFDSAVVDSIILTYKNIKNKSKSIFAKPDVSVSNISNSKKTIIPISYFLSSPSKQFDLNYSPIKSSLIDKIRKETKKLGEISETKDGIIQSKIPDILFLKEEENKYCKKILFGKDVNKFNLSFNQNWVNYQPEEMMKIEVERGGGGLRLRNKGIFEKDKILTRQTSDRIIGTIDNEFHYYSNTLHGTSITNDEYDIKYVLALMNSKTINYYYKQTTSEGGKVFAQVKIEILRQLPIKFTKYQQPIIDLVEKVFTLNQQNEDASNLEYEIDKLVYDLYGLTDEEIAIIET